MSKNIFFHWWPLESKVLTLGQIWSKNVTGAWRELSNAFFEFFLAIILLEMIANVCEKNSHFLEIWPLVTSGDLNIDLTWKWPLQKLEITSQPIQCRLQNVSTLRSFRDLRGGGPNRPPRTELALKKPDRNRVNPRPDEVWRVTRPDEGVAQRPPPLRIFKSKSRRVKIQTALERSRRTLQDTFMLTLFFDLWRHRKVKNGQKRSKCTDLR